MGVTQYRITRLHGTLADKSVNYAVSVWTFQTLAIGGRTSSKQFFGLAQQFRAKARKKSGSTAVAARDRSGGMTTAVMSLVTNGGRSTGHDNHDNGNGDEFTLLRLLAMHC